MSGLLVVLVRNLLAGSAIALVATAAGRWSRRPPLIHGLWLLFFLKLLTPPLFPIEVPWGASQQTLLRTSAPEAQPASAAIDAKDEIASADPVHATEPFEAGADEEIAAAATDPAAGNSATLPSTQASLPDVASSSFPWEQVGTWLWFTGSLCWLGLAGARLLRFRRQLRFAEPAPLALQMEVRRLAERLEVSCPRVWLLPGAVSPMLWVLGREARLLVPAGLLERLDDAQRQALFVHELAHWRRRDHWVRWLELAALGAYWWCPLVWWARRQLQEAEEECCDAWVVWMMPAAARSYALALVETLDFVASARTVLPPAASGIGHVRLLQRRLTMIMRGTTPRTLTLSGGLAVLGLGALLLPLVPSWAQSPVPESAAQPARNITDPFGATIQAQDRGLQAAPNPADRFPDFEGLEQTKKDIHRMYEELDRARRDLEQRQRDVEQRTTDLKRMMQQFKIAAKNVQINEKKTENNFGGARGTGPGIVRVPPGGAMSGAVAGVAPGQGNFGAGFGGGGIFGVAPAGEVDKRLREVERKLDMLINMMRQGARPAAPGALAPAPAATPGHTGIARPDAPTNQPFPTTIVHPVAPSNAPTLVAPAAPGQPAAPSAAPVAPVDPSSGNELRSPNTPSYPQSLTQPPRNR